MSGVQTIKVEQGEAGARLDRWFRRRFPHLTQGQLQKMVRKGQIRVDGERVETSTRVEAGQHVRVPPLPAPSSAKPEPERLSREEEAYVRSLVLYEDDEMIVFNKPHGLAVQGGTKTKDHLDRLLSAFGEDERRPRLVHRLDKDTSGLIVVGKTPAAAARLAKAFQQRETEKIYWAVVLGSPKPKQGEIKGFLKKAPGMGRDADREQMVSAEHGDPQGQYALTRYAVVADAGQRLSWVAMRPVTGRTHQLRVHMSFIGHSILGDRKYVCDRETPGGLTEKLHLHARKLTLPGKGGKPLTLIAPLPKHMAKTFASLGFDADSIDDRALHEALS